MKFFVLLGDGMADDPVKELGNQTPLQKANKPVMDHMAKYAELGLVKTVPDHLNPPGSDIANMSVLGYDPDRYYTGRSPLEAVSMGIDLAEDDIAIRCNLVTLSDESRYEDTTMVDYSSDEITTAEAGELIRFLDQKLGTDQVHFYPGVSYRHCVVLKHQKTADLHFTPPHDISGKKIASFLPKGETAAMLYDLMKKSRVLLKDHPVNLRRMQNGLRPASSVWLWGQGRKPSFDSFYERHHVKGAVISAVDLVKGLGICAGMEVPDVPGATGNIDTNYEGKADAAIAFFRSGGDFVYLHVEAPDECGHRQEIQNKVRAIEYLDQRILKKVWDYLENTGEPYRILVLPDHPTPLALRTHTHAPVPYMIYEGDRAGIRSASAEYNERDAAETGIYIEKGFQLIDRFLS